MNEWGDFMIGAAEYSFSKKAKGGWVPDIGQMDHILSEYRTNRISNLAAHTMQLYLNGDMTLHDNSDGKIGVIKNFRNIFQQDFASILRGKERLGFIKSQMFRNGAPECQDCEHADKCVMGFWKQNKPNDDCFGGKRHINWLLDYVNKNNIIISNKAVAY